MSQFTEWLQKVETQISPCELQIILNELNTNQVSLKASGVIPITYSVLTSVRVYATFHKCVLCGK